VVYSVVQYLMHAAAAAPGKVAFSDNSTSLTYGMLRQYTASVACAVSDMLAGSRRSPVFVCIDRTVESIIAFLGIAASGNFYVPIDSSLPDTRLSSIWRTMTPPLVITTKTDTRPLPFGDTRCVSLESLLAYPADISRAEKMVAETLDVDPLYCIFTSGSTGEPKGVLISHRSVIDMAEQFTELFSITSDTVFGNQAPFDFDVSVKDIYLAIKNGAEVHILEKQLFSVPKKLIERLNQYRVNTLIWSVSAMRILSALRTFQSMLPKYLRLVMFSGEALPCKILNDWMDHLPAVSFVNLYGPTEITCNCTYYKIQRRFGEQESIPIGVPFPNSGVSLWDGENWITEPGQTGEICVTGSCLALGYYNSPEQTDAAFCQEPFVDAWRRTMYRTGDLAKWDGDGNLVFLGRADSQVKHMGFRIELREVEKAAESISFVTAACCLYDAKREQLLLFYQAEKQDDVGVVQGLKQILPRFMVPGRLYYFENLPENRTGKIDRAGLRQLYLQG